MRTRNIVTFILFALLLATHGCTAESSGYKFGASTDNSELERAFKERRSNVQVEGEGTVDRLLEDDVDGSRHQRLIVRISPGQTILILHNIDIALRIDNLQTGDSVRFYGEYIWSAQGGKVHWTHHDPQGRHVAGWIKHKGKTYQ
jgi:uncharacterized protein DUF3465